MSSCYFENAFELMDPKEVLRMPEDFQSSLWAPQHCTSLPYANWYR